MSLEAAIGDLINETNGLTQTVHDKLGEIDARVGLAEAQVNTFIQQGAANFPLGPNLLQDSKKFTGLCGGQLNTILPWDQGGLGGVWGALWIDGAVGTLDVEVIYVGDTQRLTALGLYPLGDLEWLARPFSHLTLSDYGQDSNIAVFDLTITAHTPGESHIPFAFSHDCLPYTGWQLGTFKTQASAFINVMSADGLQFELFRNRAGAVPPVGEAEVGLGWRYYHGARDGFGGCNSSYVLSYDATTETYHVPIVPAAPKHIKFALALPYQGFGDHQGIPIWAGSAGRWDVGDHL